MNLLLAPFSALYALVTDIRNWMFDHGWLLEKGYDIPTICIGNLAVGGTGKTPHTEWLVSHLLAEGRRVAILSRGYGRRTRGYYEATADSRADEVGDEPLQMFHRFERQAIVAVCEDRREGITRLQSRHPDLGFIVLDDAFQHRYVYPKVRILLTEYGAPYYDDYVLPAGHLRERRRGACRADIIIVTKCPATLSSHDRRDITRKIAPQTHQQLFFTTMEYAPLPILDEKPASTRLTLLAGIAHPGPLKTHFEAAGWKISHTLFFPDHHNFTTKDIDAIHAAANDSDFVITTAKDYARLQCLNLSAETLKKIHIQHISVNALGDDTELYQTIKNHADRH